MNFIMHVTVDLMKTREQDLMDLMERKEREQKDLTERKEREKMDLMERKEREKMELSKTLTNLENDMKTRTELLLRSKRMCNMRGALEFIRSEVIFCIFVCAFCNKFYRIWFTDFFSLDRFGYGTSLARFATLQTMF